MNSNILELRLISIKDKKEIIDKKGYKRVMIPTKSLLYDESINSLICKDKISFPEAEENWGSVFLAIYLDGEYCGSNRNIRSKSIIEGSTANFPAYRLILNINTIKFNNYILEINEAYKDEGYLEYKINEIDEKLIRNNLKESIDKLKTLKYYQKLLKNIKK